MSHACHNLQCSSIICEQQNNLVYLYTAREAGRQQERWQQQCRQLQLMLLTLAVIRIARGLMRANENWRGCSRSYRITNKTFAVLYPIENLRWFIFVSTFFVFIFNYLFCENYYKNGLLWMKCVCKYKVKTFHRWINYCWHVFSLMTS